MTSECMVDGFVDQLFFYFSGLGTFLSFLNYFGICLRNDDFIRQQ